MEGELEEEEEEEARKATANVVAVRMALRGARIAAGRCASAQLTGCVRPSRCGVSSRAAAA